MKRFNPFVLLGILILSACSSPEEKLSQLSTLQLERDSLIEVKDKIASRLFELETEITFLDSNKRFLQVTALPLEVGKFERYFEVYGRVEADKNVRIFPETNGIITEITVREGQSVKKGQLLVELDASILHRNIEEVKTQLNLAKTLFEKQERLWKQKIGSEVQFLEAQNNVANLENRLSTLNAQLRMSKIRAPFDGVVDEIFPKQGELAGPASPLLRLINLSEIHIEADISESYVGQVKQGTPVKINLPNTGQSFQSTVSQVGQFINPDNRTYRIQIRVKDPEGTYKPNLLVAVKIRDYETDSAITIPNSLLLQSPDGQDYVYVVNQQEQVPTATKKFIKTGVSYGGKTEVVSGLNGTELIVEKGARSVKDGQRITLVSND
jgi:RND family efflux transporter MFP subunit